MYGGGIPSSQWCDVLVSIGHLRVHGPFVIPLCLAALLIGVTGFRRIQWSGLHLSKTYSINILLYGIMMTCAMMTDCISPSLPINVWRFFAIANAALTSSIAIFFGLNGLADLNVFSDQTVLLTMAVTIPSFGIAWTIGMISSQFNPSVHPTDLTVFLYSGTVVIGCGTFGICQSIYMHKYGYRGLKWYLFAILAGFLGFLPVASDRIAQFFCTYLGDVVSPYFGPEFVFFLGSDISVWCLVQYYINRSTVTK